VRILFVTLEDISLHKGSSTHIREKVAAFRRRGHRVIVVAGFEGNIDLDDVRNIGSIRKKGAGLSYFALAVVFMRLLFQVLKNSRDTDLIYVREPVAAFATVLTRPIHRLKIIHEVNSLDNEEIRMKGNTLAIRLAYRIVSALQHINAKFSDRIVVITERVKAYYHENYGVPENRIKVLGVTTDPEKFHPIPHADDDADAGPLKLLRRNLGIPEEAFLVSFIGNLAHWQDFDLFFDAAEMVIAKNPNVYFVITGEGSQKQWVEAAISQKRLEEKILLTGGVPHSRIALHINISDVCIALCKELASGYSPMKLFEYFACGKPVVATRVGGYEIVESANAGKLVDGGDAEGFASAILALADNGELRRECGENALKFAGDNFGWDRVISQIETLFEEIAPAAPADERKTP
jgi:glycosyltransferase involved in cell wall biosynthesis